MRKLLVNTLILFLILNFCVVSCSFDEGKVSNEKQKVNFVSGEILIRYKTDVELSERDNFKKKHNFIVLKELISLNTELIKLPEGMTVKEALDLCKNHSNIIKNVEPNYHRALMEAQDE